MSGKSGQLLTSTFFDDCENIVLYNGYPVFVVNRDEFFDGVYHVTFSSFEEASKRLGLSVDVLKDLTRLGNVKLLIKSAMDRQSRMEILPIRFSFTVKSVSNHVDTIVEFGDSVNGLYLLKIAYEQSGEFVSAFFQFVQE